MNIPKATKLKSGKWRIQIMVNAHRYSVTDVDLNVCKQKAKELYAGIEQEERVPLLLKEAYTRYIDSNDGTLSPSTIRNYRVYQRNYFQDLMTCKICDLTAEKIQRAISAEAKAGKSPKTIRNAYSLLSVVLKTYRPMFKLNAKLPQKRRNEITIPTEEEIQRIWAAAKGTKYELPILLASWLGLRASEIRGLKFEDVVGNRIHVQRAVVKGDHGLVEKGTKSISGDRWITCPEEILRLIDARPRDSEYVLGKFNVDLYDHFRQVCKLAGVTPCRFHDLWHFAASEAHSLGVPDKYQMKRMGHKTDNMLKNVYQHTMKEKEDYFANTIDNRMRSIYQASEDPKSAI